MRTLVAAILLFASGTATAASRLAIVPLRAAGVQRNDAERFEDAIRAALASTPDVELQDKALTTDFLESARSLGVTCAIEEPACTSTLAKVADVDLVLLGSARAISAGKIGVVLSLIHQSGRVERVVRGTLPPDVDAQPGAAAALAQLLLDPSPALGTITLTSSEPQATVFIDGESVGDSPLAQPIGGLVPGTHEVVVEKKGFLRFTAPLSVVGGESVQLTATLLLDPDAVIVEPPSPVPGAIMTGAGVLLLAGGVVALAVGAQPWLAIEDNDSAIANENKRATAPGYPERVARLYREGESAREQWTQWGQSTFATGAGLAAVGALVAIGGAGWALFALLGSDAEATPEDDGAATRAPASPASPASARHDG